MQELQPNTLAYRCALMVAHANQLIAYMPMTILSVTPDAVDERVAYVRIQHDDGLIGEAVMVMNWLCPATVAEAALRAFIYKDDPLPPRIEDDYADADEPGEAPPDPIRGRGRMN